MKKILCFGDSNTWGHNPVDCSRLDERWTVMIEDKFPQYEITADGLCGRATRTFKSEMHDTDGLSAFREKYINSDENYDLIIIMLGTNDVLSEVNSSPTDIADTLGEYISEYRGAHTENATEFLLISPILLTDKLLSHPIFSQLYSETSIEKSKHFAQCISNVAKRENVWFMNAAEYAEASDIDGIHMTSQQHRKLADGIENKISEILK